MCCESVSGGVSLFSGSLLEMKDSQVIACGEDGVSVCGWTRSYVYVYVCIYMYVCMCICICVYMYVLWIISRDDMCFSASVSVCLCQSMCLSASVPFCPRVSACIAHTHTHTLACMCVCLCVCVHACMHAAPRHPQGQGHT